MPQTLLAFLAMMIAMLFSMHQQRSMLQAQRDMVNAEMEVMASSIASERMQHFAALPFDEHMGGMSPRTATPAQLTPPGAFGKDCAIDTCEDLDDFDGNTSEIFFEAGTDEEGAPVQFGFDVEPRVSYVDEDGDETTERTWTKRVTLVITNEYLLSPVVVERDFSPRWE